VQAKLGAPLAQVAAEARASLSPKIVQLAPLQNPTTPASPSPLSVGIAVRNAVGLHARPAARFVQTAGRFKADIRVTNTSNGRGPANAKSITGVLTLGARFGHSLSLTATGPDAQEALNALRQLAEANFGDNDEAAPTPSTR
jgi:phosphocarrier protein FPr